MVISILNAWPRVSEYRLLALTFGFMVTMLFFMEKHRWKRRPCVFPWYRPRWCLLESEGVGVPNGDSF
jgi:hypothetical protein